MSQNKVLSTIYEQVKLLKQTWRKNIVLLKNRNNGQYSIAKVQIRNDSSNASERTVRHQGKFLLETQGHVGIPIMRWVGKDGPYDVLIVQKLGDSLFQLFQKECQNKFSLKTVCMLGVKMIKILQNYHSKGYVHRNINPGSFQMGLSQKNTELYFNDLIDSISYINKKNFRHIENKGGCKITYATGFMTAEQLCGGQCSRRTDMEALIMILIYFLKGKLPWTLIAEQQYESLQKKAEKIYEKVMTIPPDQLCKGLPVQFEEMLIEVRNMEFEEEPTYFYYIQQLARVMYRAGLEDDDIFDWLRRKNEKTGKRDFIEKLRVSKHVATLSDVKLKPYQDILLKTYYEPFSDKVEIDQITQKYASVTQSRLKTEQLYEEPFEGANNDKSKDLSKKAKSMKSIPSQKDALANRKKENCEIY